MQKILTNMTYNINPSNVHTITTNLNFPHNKVTHILMLQKSIFIIYENY